MCFCQNKKGWNPKNQKKSLELCCCVEREFLERNKNSTCYAITSICDFRSGSCFTVAWPASIAGFMGRKLVNKMYERSYLSLK